MWFRFLLLSYLLGPSLPVAAQPSPPYPKGYFRNPLGFPMQLTANFGELRPDHWHMGLDIRTNAKENQPVYAAAEGYIAKVGIRPQSFGRFIIINHPNGLSTLYGHLNDFYPELESYVTAQQYRQESWAAELYFTKDQFPVTKGTFIAYSGNTGGSMGAHLHFEILDTQSEKRLNPLLFGFPLEDNIPPSITRLAMYDRSRSVYEQSPVFFSVKKSGSSYIIPKMPVIKTGFDKISFALEMFDKMNGAGSNDGVYSAKLYADHLPQISFILDSIDYEETVLINAHIDYKLYYDKGIYVQHLSKLPGRKDAEYKRMGSNGVLKFADTAIHNITIDVFDAYGNSSQLNFAIQHSDSPVAENFPGANPKFIPGQVNALEKPGFKAYLPENCIYDSVPVFYASSADPEYNAVSETYSVGNSSFPVHVPMAVRLKQSIDISDAQKRKLVIERKDRKERQIKKAEWQDGWITARFGDFGNFRAFTDLTPPQVNDPSGYRKGQGDTIDLSAVSRIVFTPTDNFGIIKSFRAELDRRWIRFTNDKSRNWIYTFDERCPYGIHHLKVVVEDLVGNVTEKNWWFDRHPYTPPPKKKKVVKKASGNKKLKK